MTDNNYLAFLDKIYPEESIVPGGSFDTYTLHPVTYNYGAQVGFCNIPVSVPAIVARFTPCWTLNHSFPTAISLLNATGNVVETKNVKKWEILDIHDTPRLSAIFDTAFNIQNAGVYYFKLGPEKYLTYSWTKNNTKFFDPD